MQDNVAIVTGASRGVGRSLATYLATLGYLVVLVARNKKLLEQVSQQIIEVGGKSIVFTIDVSNSHRVQSCIDQIIREYGRIDLLVNNAAILKRGTTELSDEETEELLKINLNGAIYVAKYVAAQMKKQQNGYIINMSSLGVKQPPLFQGYMLLQSLDCLDLVKHYRKRCHYTGLK